MYSIVSGNNLVGLNSGGVLGANSINIGGTETVTSDNTVVIRSNWNIVYCNGGISWRWCWYSKF